MVPVCVRDFRHRPPNKATGSLRSTSKGYKKPTVRGESSDEEGEQQQDSSDTNDNSSESSEEFIEPDDEISESGSVLEFQPRSRSPRSPASRRAEQSNMSYHQRYNDQYGEDQLRPRRRSVQFDDAGVTCDDGAGSNFSTYDHTQSPTQGYYRPHTARMVENQSNYQPTDQHYSSPHQNPSQESYLRDYSYSGQQHNSQRWNHRNQGSRREDTHDQIFQPSSQSRNSNPQYQQKPPYPSFSQQQSTTSQGPRRAEEPRSHALSQPPLFSRREFSNSEIAESRQRVEDDAIQNFRAWQAGEAEDLRGYMDTMAMQWDDTLAERKQLLSRLADLPNIVKSEESQLRYYAESSRPEVLDGRLRALWDWAMTERSTIQTEGKALDRRMEQIVEEYDRMALRRHHVLGFQWPGFC